MMTEGHGLFLRMGYVEVQVRDTRRLLWENVLDSSMKRHVMLLTLRIGRTERPCYYTLDESHRAQLIEKSRPNDRIPSTVPK